MNTPGFGRKAAAPKTAESAPPRPKHPAFKYLAGLTVLVALAGAAYGTYENRDHLAAKFAPWLLSQMKIDNHSQRLVRYWDGSGPSHEVYAELYWATTRLYQLCGSIGYPKYSDKSQAYTNANPFAPNRYMVDKFGRRPMREVIEEIERAPESFCSNDYFLAMYDARLVISPHTEAFIRHNWSARSTVSSAWDETPTQTQFRPTAPDMNINAHCANKWGTDYRMQDYCRRQQEGARIWARGAAIDDDIAIRCAAEWPADWNMFAYCARNQMVAKSRL